MSETPDPVAAAAARVLKFLDRHDKDPDAVRRGRQILFDWTLAAADYDRAVVEETPANAQRIAADPSLLPTERVGRGKPEDQLKSVAYLLERSSRTLRELWNGLYSDDVPGHFAGEDNGFPPEMIQAALRRAGSWDGWLALYSFRERRLRAAVACARAMEAARTADPLPDATAVIETSSIVENARALLVTFRGVSVAIAKGAGEERLVRLLLNPGQAFSAAELLREQAERSRVRAAAATEVDPEGAAGPSVDTMLDKKALAAYKARLDEIAQESEEARRNNDEATQERLRREGGDIMDVLAQALGHGGTVRRLDPAEANRQERVAKSISRATEQLPDPMASFVTARLTLASGRNRYEPREGDGPEATFVLSPAT